MNDTAIIDLIGFLQCVDEQDLYEEDADAIALYSYRKWALTEALKRAVDRPFVSIEDILVNFMLELDCYAKNYSRDPSSINRLNPFAAAYDQIETVLAMIETPSE